MTTSATPRPLHRWSLVDKTGKTRLTCQATEGNGMFYDLNAHTAFVHMRGGRKIPDGWSIVNRGPVKEPQPVTLETLAQEVGHTPLREMDGPTQQTALALAAIPGKNTKPQPAAPVPDQVTEPAPKPRPFQIGDKVKRINHNNTENVPVGSTGKVIRPLVFGTVRVQWDHLPTYEGTGCESLPENLELIEPVTKIEAGLPCECGRLTVMTDKGMVCPVCALEQVEKLKTDLEAATAHTAGVMCAHCRKRFLFENYSSITEAGEAVRQHTMNCDQNPSAKRIWEMEAEDRLKGGRIMDLEAQLRETRARLEDTKEAFREQESRTLLNVRTVAGPAEVALFNGTAWQAADLATQVHLVKALRVAIGSAEGRLKREHQVAVLPEKEA